MKKMLLLVGLMSGLTFATYAQEVQSKPVKRTDRGEKMINKTPEEMATLQTERLDKDLKFTEAQKKQVYAIQLKSAQKQKEVMTDQKAGREAFREGMKQNQEELNKVLTPEQQNILKEKRAQRGDHMKGKRKMDGELRSKKAEKTAPAEDKTSL